MKNHNKQSGFIVLMGMLVIVLGAAVWFGTLGQVRSNTMMIDRHDKNIAELHNIKQRMLTFAAIQPELYNNVPNVPGPGYLPCPDQDNDGDMDTGCGFPGVDEQLFVIGQVPFKIATRNFTFIDSQQDRNLFWFAVDTRFVYDSHNGLYFYLDNAGETSNRFAGLNTSLPTLVEDRNGAMVPPLTLDGKDEIVMVLFYAGDALGGQNRVANANPANYLEQGALTDGLTHDFSSTGAVNAFNDYVITITRDEWQTAVLSRVAQDNNPADGVVDLCTMPIDQQHWFNECKYTGIAVPQDKEPDVCTPTTITIEENIVGQNWRAIAC